MKKLIALFILCALTTAGNAQSLTIQLSKTNITCYNARNGSVNLTVSGGTSPYTFLWSNGATTEDISSLSPSYYAVTVTDAASNTAADGVTVTEPSQITFSFTLSDYVVNGTHYHLSSFDWHNGSITSSVSGGVPGYTYSWSNSATTANISSLDAGTYKLTVTDASGCTRISESIVMTKPDKLSWGMTGNGSTNPSTQFIGTTDAQDVSFRSDNSERLRVKANGDVKINSLGGSNAGMLYTDIDGYVWSASKTSNPCTGVGVVWNSLPSPDYVLYTCPYVKVGIGTSTPVNKADINGSVAIGSYAGTTPAAPANGLIVSGKVGIGIASPNESLEVNGTTKTNSLQTLAFRMSTGNTNGYVLQSDAAGNASWVIPSTIGADVTTASNGLTETGTDVRLGGALTGSTSIDQAGYDFSLYSGKLGIGTVNPSELVQFGDRFVFHNGGTKVLGRNFKHTNQPERLVTGEPVSLIAFNAAGDISFDQGPSGPLNTAVTLTTAFFIKNNSYIGIGNINPANKLDVSGGVAIGNYAGSNTTAPLNGMIVSGNVGIGTDSPTEQLQINDGNLYINGEDKGLIVDANAKRIGFMKYSTKEAGIWRTAGQDFEIGRVNNTLQVPNGFTTDLYIKGNGSVGIGTDSPNGNFEVKGTNCWNYFTATGTGSASVNLKNDNGYWQISGPRTSEAAGEPLSFIWNNGSDHRAMDILHDASGNTTVSIGLNLNDFNANANNGFNYKFLVGGKLGANEIWCALGNASTPWPDYVFNKNYSLRTIDELNSFITSEKHLPGMPSAKEVAGQDKINLGDMQIKQLEKIEEAYLYILQLKKEIDQLKVENIKLMYLVQKK